MTRGTIAFAPPLPPAVHWRRATERPPFPLAEATCRLYSRARNGLYGGVRALGLGPGDAVMVPAWHHGSEVEAFLQAGLDCRFYEATGDLEPDESELEALLDPSVRALHLIHYLGLPRDASRWRRWCDKRGLFLLEDAAQAWLSQREGSPVGSCGDLAVFCLYKTYGVPDGAALVSRNPPPPLLPSGRPSGFEGLLRRHGAWLLQRSGRLSALDRRFERVTGLPPFSHQEDIELPEPRPPSWATSRIVARLDASAAASRRANYAALLGELSGLVPAPFDVLADGASPYVLPITTGDKDGVMHRLAGKGVVALSLWTYPHPTLPPVFPGADTARSTYVGLPVHQELHHSDLDRLVEAVRQCVPELSR